MDSFRYISFRSAIWDFFLFAFEQEEKLKKKEKSNKHSRRPLGRWGFMSWKDGFRFFFAFLCFVRLLSTSIGLNGEPADQEINSKEKEIHRKQIKNEVMKKNETKLV